jgi:hypothetical protein
MPSRYRWEAAVRRYRGPSGRFVSPLEVRGAIDDTITASARRMGMLSAQLQGRAITIAEWQRGMRDAMRDMHTSSAAAAAGGWREMSPAHYGRVGGRLRQQYAYLQRFALQLQSGEQPMDGRFAVRAQMYANAARGTYEAARRTGERNGGMTRERRILHSHEACGDCEGYAALGWQPIGTLPNIGEASVCLTSCLCTFDYHAGP